MLFRQAYGTSAAFFDIRHLWHAFAAEALGDITPLNLEKNVINVSNEFNFTAVESSFKSARTSKIFGLNALNRSCALLSFRVSIQQTDDFKKLYGKLNLGSSSHWHSSGIVLHAYLYGLPSAVTPGCLTFKERPHHAGKKKIWIKHRQLNCLKSTLYLFCVMSWCKRLKAWIREVFIVPISFSPNNINKQSTKKVLRIITITQAEIVWSFIKLS